MTWWGLRIAWVYLFLFTYPPVDLAIHTVDRALSMHLQIPLATSITLIFLVNNVFVFDMTSTSKYMTDDFSTNMEAVTGIIGLAGGLGGFLLPVIFGVLLDVFRMHSSCFVLLYGIVWVSLILLYLSEMRWTPLAGHAGWRVVQ